MGALGGWPRQEEPGAKDGRGTRAVGDDDGRLVIKVNKLLRRYDEGHLVIEPTELEGASRLPFCTGTLRICGEGGYGVVFESTLVDNNAAVAVKMLSPDRFHEHFSLAAFEREGQFLKSIQQVNSRRKWMPEFYGSGMFIVDSQRVPWMSMELLDASLVDVPPDSTNLDRGKMYVQMIDALESLHELGHLHRDVKPENFMIRRRQGREEEVVLIDYGLVQSIEACSVDTGSWKFCGTVPFASDRQLLGLPTGPADDLESLVYSIIVMELESVPWEKFPSDTCWSSMNRSDFRLELENEVWNREEVLKGLFENGYLPGYMARWLKHCKETEHTNKPDYALLKRLTLSAVQKRLIHDCDDELQSRKKARLVRQEE
ncbi:hypothetical protein M9434_002988 [Picochlorum sp. BPE23]|nr:hypothetical protein M9434_002988 [Picochlorum sp. BPE23]